MAKQVISKGGFN